MKELCVKHGRGRTCFILLIMLCLLTPLFSAKADGIVVAFEKRQYTLLAGKTISIQPIIQGTKKKGTYQYSSDDPGIATVRNGQVKGVAAGETTIHCTVTIDGTPYSCEYKLIIQQPITKMQAKEKEITLPANAILKEALIEIIPPNATNQEITYSSSNGKVAFVRGNTLYTGSTYGTATITCKANDGSGAKTAFKVTVPKAAWFSVQKDVTISDPAGIDVYYISTYTSGFNSGSHYCSNQAISAHLVVFSDPAEKEKDIQSFLATQPFTLDQAYGYRGVIKMHLSPEKEGKSKFAVVTNGWEASINVTVKRSAVYERIQYEQFAKNAKKLTGLRFDVSGYPFQTGASSDDSSIVFLAMDGDEARQVKLIIPGDVDGQTLKQGKTVDVQGVFQGMEPYKTETGLSKDIPVIAVERIK